MNRRSFLFGLGALIAAPAIVRPGIIMPIKVIKLPPPRYPGELLLPERDLKIWVEELDIGFEYNEMDIDHLHSERTLDAVSRLQQRGRMLRIYREDGASAWSTRNLSIWRNREGETA